MANPENLKGYGFDERAPNEQREIARAGGVASGAARRRKRDFRKLTQEILSEKPDTRNLKYAKQLEAIGFDAEDMDFRKMIIASLIMKAISGNIKAMELVLEYAGEDAYSMISQKKASLERERLKIEKKRLELEERRAAGGSSKVEDISSEFIAAMSASGKEVWSDGGDEPENIHDSDNIASGSDAE